MPWTTAFIGSSSSSPGLAGRAFHLAPRMRHRWIRPNHATLIPSLATSVVEHPRASGTPMTRIMSPEEANLFNETGHKPARQVSCLWSALRDLLSPLRLSDHRGGPRHRGYSGDCGRFAVESVGVDVQRAPAGASAAPCVVARGASCTLGAQHTGDQVPGGRTGPPATADVGAVAGRRLGPRWPPAGGVRAGRDGPAPGRRTSRIPGRGLGGAGGWATRVRDHRSWSGTRVVFIPPAGPSAHDRADVRGAAGRDRQP